MEKETNVQSEISQDEQQNTTPKKPLEDKELCKAKEDEIIKKIIAIFAENDLTVYQSKMILFDAKDAIEQQKVVSENP